MPIVRFPDADATEWRERMSDSSPLVLFKHSPACGLSAIAMEEVKAFSSENPEVTIQVVDVLGQRSLSNAIESVLGIRHESPQTIVFRDGQPMWHGSHRKVTKVMLEKATE
jgi:bacillithiol system protein YtxJ